jgi:hypothetical protein
MQVRLKEFEIEKKYETERIKNATFELQLQLKVKIESLRKCEEELETLRSLNKTTYMRETIHLKETIKEGTSSQSSLPVKEMIPNLNNYLASECVEALLSGREKTTLKLHDATFKAAFFEERKSLKSQTTPMIIPEEMT